MRITNKDLDVLNAFVKANRPLKTLEVAKASKCFVSSDVKYNILKLISIGKLERAGEGIYKLKSNSGGINGDRL